jgi:hypothetical protein
MNHLLKIGDIVRLTSSAYLDHLEIGLIGTVKHLSLTDNQSIYTIQWSNGETDTDVYPDEVTQLQD